MKFTSLLTGIRRTVNKAMTNEEFLMKLYQTNGHEILDLSDSQGDIKIHSVDLDGNKTYRFSSYGSQEWVNIYYIKFDKDGNFMSIEYNENESFC